MGTLLGNMEGAPLLGTLRESKKKYFKWEVKMPFKGVFLSIGAQLGNLDGIRLLELFEGKG